MRHRVFSQAKDLRIDVAALVRHAQRFFEASMDVLQARDGTAGSAGEAAPFGHEVRVRISSARRGFSDEFWVRSREARAEDWAAAQEAEVRGRATGMSALAARCHVIWELEPIGGAGEAGALNLCALLAAVALGPVLPADGSTLFGIRGAMERLDKLTGPSLAR